MKKIKALLLGYNDVNLSGHAYYDYITLPEYYDKRIVVQYTLSNNKNIALYQNDSLYYKLLKKYRWYKFQLKCLLYSKKKFKANILNPEFHYNYIEDIADSSNKILKKIGNFVPDVILIYWTSQFLNYKTIKDLHEKTKAHIYIFFVDEAPMTGGCHYPIECQQYKNDCNNCPAINISNLSKRQLLNKIKYLRKIPHTIIATPYDCKLAQQSTLFKNTKYIESISIPDVTFFSKNVARNQFSINDNEFVILIGANHIRSKRKGFKYSLQVLKKFTFDKDNITIIALGQNIDLNLFKDIKARIITPGFVDHVSMCKAYCASDCFLSTSIADSGPMTVNYSICLGIPVISFNIGIASTLVKNKETGWCSELKDIEGLVDGLNYFYNLTHNQKDRISNNCFSLIKEIQSKKTWYLQVYEQWNKIKP